MNFDDNLSARDRYLTGYNPNFRIKSYVPFIYVDQSVPDWKKRLNSLVSYLGKPKFEFREHMYVGYFGAEDVIHLCGRIRILFQESEHFLGPEEVELRAREFSHTKHAYVLFMDMGTEGWDYNYDRYIRDTAQEDVYKFSNGFLVSSGKLSRGVV